MYTYDKQIFFSKGLHGRSIESRISEEADLLCENVRKKQGKPFIIEVSIKLNLPSRINLWEGNTTENKETTSIEEKKQISKKV